MPSSVSIAPAEERDQLKILLKALQGLDREPGGPALAVLEVVVGLEVEDERRVDPAQRVGVGVAVREKVLERVSALGVVLRIHR